MSISLGLVGLPSAGKTTLLNALGMAKAQVANYPFTTIEPNVASAPVPDLRLDEIARIVKPGRVVPTAIDFVDIAGLIRGSHKGEGLGNQFLSHIRAVDAVVVVLRFFQDPDVIHVEGTIDPARDMDIIQLELVLADLALAQRRRDNAAKAAKGGDKPRLQEVALWDRLIEHLNAGQPVRTMGLDESEWHVLSWEGLLTIKPVLYVANGEESLCSSQVEDSLLSAVQERAQGEGAELLVVAAQTEAELSQWPEEDARAYRQEAGMGESGLEKLIHASYRLLRLVTFFTTGEKEVRAWTLVQGTPAEKAAGKVHTDMERGFIRAEVIPARDLIACGSFSHAREKGLIRLEGRDYIIVDGDVVYFRFHV